MARINQSSPPLLSLREVAAELRCSIDSVRRRVRAGQLPAYRIGENPSARIRVSRQDLDAYLARHYLPGATTKEVEASDPEQWPVETDTKT